MDYCAAGHDLTLPDAYIHLANGNRDCRQCIVATKGKRPKVSNHPTKGAFDG